MSPALSSMGLLCAKAAKAARTGSAAKNTRPQQAGDLLNPLTTSLEAQKVATWHHKHGLLHVVLLCSASEG